MSEEDKVLNQQMAPKANKAGPVTSGLSPPPPRPGYSTPIGTPISSERTFRWRRQLPMKNLQGILKRVLETLKVKLKELADSKNILEMSQTMDEMGNLYVQLGDKTNGDKFHKKASELMVQGLQTAEKQLDQDAKVALKKKDYETAAEKYDKLSQIATRLFKMGMMDYNNKIKVYQKAKADCDAKK